MDAHEEQRYAQLRAHLDMDLLHIDDHLVQLPQFQIEASEYASDAARRNAEADGVLLIEKAEAARRIRERPGDKKPTVAEVSELVELDETVAAAKLDSIDAQHDKDRWRGLVDAFRTKSSLLKTAAELINSGYLSPRTVVDNGREALRRSKERQEGK